MVAAADAAQAQAREGAGAGAEQAAGGEQAAAAAAVVDPNAGRESALLRSVRQQERAVVQQRQQLAERERQIGQNVEQQVQRAVQERMAKLKTDPIAALRELGFDDATIASRLLNQGKQTPQEIAQQALDEAKRVREENSQRSAADARQRAETDFAAEAADETKYPHLNEEWTRSEFVREAHAVVTNLRAKGIDPGQYSYSDIAKYLDKQAKGRAERREKIKAERSKKVPPQGDNKAEGNGVSGQGGSSGKTATTTLGQGLGGRQSLNGKAGHLMTDAELAASVEAEVARSRAAMGGRA